MTKIEICRSAPATGFKSEPQIWSANERIELINLLSETGVSRIEAVSFVHPKRVPQMAEAETVMAGINRKEGVTYAGLALNARAQTALLPQASMKSATWSLPARPSIKNQGASVDDTMSGYAEIAGKVTKAGLKLTGVIGAAFGCPRGRRRSVSGCQPDKTPDGRWRYRNRIGRYHRGSSTHTNNGHAQSSTGCSR